MKEITVLFNVITVYLFICDRKPSTSIEAKMSHSQFRYIWGYIWLYKVHRMTFKQFYIYDSPPRDLSIANLTLHSDSTVQKPPKIGTAVCDAQRVTEA